MKFIGAVFCLISAMSAQVPASNIVVGAGYALPAPVKVTPGQVLTFFVQGAGSKLTQAVRVPPGADFPTSLAGISVSLDGHEVPIIEVRPISTCPGTSSQSLFPQPPCSGGTLAAITVQIPYGFLGYCGSQCGLGPTYTLAPMALWVSENGSAGAMIELTPFYSQVHILTACDTVLANPASRFNQSGLPCLPLVTHADGSLVSGQSPAKPGEEIVAYATGLGATDPPVTAGKIVSSTAPTKNSFLLDFNFRVNVGPAKPYLLQFPVFTGLTPGYAGLYQINFVVPQPPAGLPPCSPGAGDSGFQSNLTVSVGGPFGESYDGAGICVSVP
jgi:uncharacterized protein (TIGR03437 family)